VPHAPLSAIHSAATASLVVDLLASDGGVPDDDDATAGTPTPAATPAAAVTPAADAHERLRLCAHLLEAGGAPLRQAVELAFRERPWLGGLAARGLVFRVRYGLRAARSPLLPPPSSRPSRTRTPSHSSTTVEAIVDALLLGAADDGADAQLLRAACISAAVPATPAESAEAAQGAAVAAAAALPPAVQICEALGMGGTRLRATVEWQLAGLLSATNGGGARMPILLANAMLGGVGDADSSSARAGKQPEKAPAPRATTNARLPTDLDMGEGEDGILTNRVSWFATATLVRTMPHWTTVLSCALVLLAGGAAIQ